jgi:hypothetical protein
MTNDTSIHMTPREFASQFYNFILSIEVNALIGGWTYEGATDHAYGTPGGAWDREGFTFSNDEYSFIIRSVWNSGGNGDLSYLVVESNNLEGQLANVALDNPAKYVNKDGDISIIETFDMTVGYGRRSRNDVREAFTKFGKQDAVITRFKEEAVNWIEVLIDILKWSVFREKVKEYFQNENTGVYEPPIPVSQYWVLSLFENKYWEEEEVYELKVGSVRLLSQRTGFNSGDKGLGYSHSKDQSILFFFDIIAEAASLSEEDGFVFKITRKLNNPLPLTAVDKLIKYSNYLNRDINANELFPIDSDDYRAVLHTLDPGAVRAEDIFFHNNIALSHVSPDDPSADIEDQLEFASDVNALASVIVYREIKPPLAIGLFGNWGSGKSFFMNKLQQRINRLARLEGDIFCKNVLQINFNSWHYSDTNLWASLITKIFEELEEYGKGADKRKEGSVARLFENLGITQELIETTEVEKQEVIKNIEELSKKQKIVEELIDRQSKELGRLTSEDILEEVKKDKQVVDEMNDLNKAYDFVGFEGAEDMEENITFLQDSGSKLIKSVRIVYFSGFRRAWKAVAFLVTVLLVFYFLIQSAGRFKPYLVQFQGFILLTAGLLSQFAGFIRPKVRQLNGIYTRLVDLRKLVRDLKAKSREKYAPEIEQVKKELAMEESKKRAIRQEIDMLKVKQVSLQNKIDDIVSGKKITKFIEGRVIDERYVSNLGIISWIRKDFEELDFLLKEQYDARKLAELGRHPVEGIFKLDRIILYIDDLDRCKENIVIKVLEAIHLLLAFPLFVVVVGVDPRWMNNALDRTYSHLLNGPENKSGQAVTSYDYLEKIFQIPFALKPTDKNGRERLIRSQFKADEFQERRNDTIMTSSQNISAVNVEQIDPDHTIKHLKEEELEELFIVEKEIRPETLKVSKAEIRFMEEISVLIGDSPRTLKRFVNIYRIIRTHEKFFVEYGWEYDYYCAAMLLLAVVIGLPLAAGSFLQALERSEGQESFKVFLERYVQEHVDDPFILKLQKAMNASLLDDAANIRVTTYKRNIELLSRFSFRTPI